MILVTGAAGFLGRRVVRISAQLYNARADYQALANALSGRLASPGETA